MKVDVAASSHPWTPQQVADYAAALEFCKASTIKRRLLDSLALKSGPERGIREFVLRQSLLREQFSDVSNRFEEIFADSPDIRPITVHDSSYPSLLRTIPSPPAVIFARGNIELAWRKCVAVVGTRKASERGLMRAASIARGLVEAGFIVVSGLARGIDGAAHTAALAAKEKDSTVSVLGTPLDKTYPAEHRSLQERIASNGLLISQFPSGLRVTPFNFPERNRVMSGVSLATVVVEAGDTSGAVIQARQCFSQGRALFITDIVRADHSLKWPNNYLKRGAVVVTSAAQIIADLNRR